MRITIPLPPVALRAQNQGHWWGKSKAVKEYRETCALLARVAKQGAVRSGKTFPFASKVRLHHTWHMGQSLAKVYRPKDEQNAIFALKAAVDGFVDAGILKDDDAKHLCWGEFVPLRVKKEHLGRCEIVVDLEVEDES